MKLADYHVHSNHSCDGKDTILEMCQRAAELGIAEIGFSEHMDFEPEDPGFGFFDYEGYAAEIGDIQEFFKKKLIVRKGIEIDYQQAFEDDIREWLKDKEFDFIIGSVHYVNHELIDHELLKDRDLERIYRTYFREVALSIESRLFDVIGHLDVVRKFIDVGIAEFRRFDYVQSIGIALDMIVEKRAYLEINSKPLLLKETSIRMLPSEEAFRDFIGKGGRLISIGSDAHSIEEIGGGIMEVMSFLKTFKENKLQLLFE
ncbi:MAG: histidinol-phosphatase HisJ family protein [Candidatus Bathyarchaeota archaeon]|nr:MAG: histidinol-phosphatase HisJ family protein [Candidatus Bathyarchaeota archaeon]